MCADPDFVTFWEPICPAGVQNAIARVTICRHGFGRLKAKNGKMTTKKTGEATSKAGGSERADASPDRPGQALDRIDHLLLAKLRENSRASVSELGRELGLSRTTVQSRIKRLERAKVITGYSVRVAETHEKNQIHAYVMITVGPKRAAAVSAEIKRMAPVRLLQSVSGPFDMIALAVAPSVREMDDLIDAIGNLDGVERTTSSVVLSTKFDR
jgi:DNA-binding Lrp family transcriptional regulator